MSEQPEQRLREVHSRIRAAAQAAGRAAETVTLIAASKTRSAAEIRGLAAWGVRDFGENYVQEALAKQAGLEDLALTWHFIGPVQGNKTRSLAERFDWVHSVDRSRILRRLSGQRPPDRGPLNVCLQVNLDAETGKAGLAPDEVAAVLAEGLDLNGIRIRGLMAIPAPRKDPVRQRDPFRRLAALAGDLRRRFPAARLDVLSMGMSADLEAAVAEGATHLRVGAALFGPRPAPSRQRQAGGTQT